MRLLGIVIFTIGLVVLGYGLSPSQAIAEKVIEGVSGQETSNTMWYIIGGGSMILGGIALAFFGRNK